MKVGDLVKLSLYGGTAEGLGIVLAGQDHQGCVQVYWFGGVGYDWCDPDSLEIVNESR